MKLTARISAAVSGLVTGKSFAAAAAAFRRGDDVIDGSTSAAFTQPYAQSAWVNDAVHKRASEISGRPVKFYDGENEYDDRAFSDWWAAPAIGPKTLGGMQPRLTLDEVLFDCEAWRALEGEMFLCLDDAWLLATGSRNPAALTPFLIANPQRMQVIVQSGVLAGWRYCDAGGRQIIFLPEQVIHKKTFNPYDDWRGLGSLAPAMVAAGGAFSTGIYIRDLMRNNGDQGFIVIGKGGPASAEVQEQVKADLRAKRAALRRGVAKDLFISGPDLSIDRPKEQAASADLVSCLTLSQQEIFVAFHVPPSMATVKQAYSIGKDSDRYQLITGTCQPEGNAIAGALAKIGSRMTGRTLTAELDWDDHPVMVEVRNGRIESLLKLWGVGVPVKTANTYLDLGLDEFPGWDKSYLPFSVSESGGAAAEPEPSKDPALAEPPVKELPEISVLKALIASRSRTCVNVTPEKKTAPAVVDEFAAFQCQCGGDIVSQLASRDPEEIKWWKAQMRERRASVSGYKSAFGRVLMQARVEVLRKIDSSYAPADKTRTAIQTKAAAGDFLFDLSKFGESFRAAMRRQAISTLDQAAKQLLKEVGREDDPFEFAPHEVLSFLSDRENKLKGVPQDVWDSIRDELIKGIDDGDSVTNLAARVKKEFNTLGDREALRIAQTEVSASFGKGRDVAMRRVGVKYKAWITSGNDNVRDAHVLAGADYPPERAIPIDEPFIVDGEPLMYPGDTSGKASNVISCFCVSRSIFQKPDSDA